MSEELFPGWEGRVIECDKRESSVAYYWWCRKHDVLGGSGQSRCFKAITAELEADLKAERGLQQELAKQLKEAEADLKATEEARVRCAKDHNRLYRELEASRAEVKSWEAYFDGRVQDSPKIKRLEAEVEGLMASAVLGLTKACMEMRDCNRLNQAQCHAPEIYEEYLEKAILTSAKGGGR